MSVQQAQRDISHYLMHRYNWIRPHTLNGGLAPAQAEKNLKSCPGLVDHYITPVSGLENGYWISVKMDNL